VSRILTPSGLPEAPDGPSRGTLAMRGVLFVLAGAGLGALAGVIWWAVVPLPTYTVEPNGGANTTQQGLTQYVAGDAWFSLIGFVVGLAIGFAGWRLFRRIGWPVVALAIVGAVVAALVCWWVGWELGPGPFPARLAGASPGAQVPIELTLRAPVAVLVWPFAAVLVILLGSSLGRDEEEPRPIFGRGPRRSAT
jgi:hypothetical protein